MDDNQVIDVVLQFEGGFVDNPADRGGPTNFGITAAQLGRWLHLATTASVDQVRRLTKDQARDIYRTWYIAQPGFNKITNDNLRIVLVDSGVLHGPGRAIKWLQQALNIAIDGVLGPTTEQAVSGADQGKLARQVLALRFRSIAEIVAADRSQVAFLRGWISRAVALLDYA